MQKKKRKTLDADALGFSAQSKHNLGIFWTKLIILVQEVVILPLRCQFDVLCVFFFLEKHFKSLINQKTGKLAITRLLMSGEIDSIQTENREENLALFAKAFTIEWACLGMRKTKAM